MPEIRDWKCGHCGLVIDLPDHDTERDLFVDAMNRIREHRLAHLVAALESGSDRELTGLCEDEPAEPLIPSCWVDEFDEAVARATESEAGPITLDNISSAMERLWHSGHGPRVDSDDVAPVLAGITELLRDDLPRARKLWYPINEDGGFNR